MMVVVVGGSFQGKTEYVKKSFPQISFLQAGDLSLEEIGEAQGILNLQDYLWRVLSQAREKEWKSLEFSLDRLSERRAKREEPGQIIRNGRLDLEDHLALLLEILCDGRDRVITLQEVGGGVVPLDAFERCYREVVGRFGGLLCQEACQVVRLSFGLPQVIKPGRACPGKNALEQGL